MKNSLNVSDRQTERHHELQLSDGTRIAYCRLSPMGFGAKRPGVIFLGGFKSDMSGTKALFLEEHCRARGLGFLRFDYSGHGQSSGDFTEGTIGRWRDEAVSALDELTDGPQVLVGSSMGGWIMLLVALSRRQRVAGLIGIASAPDFTEDLIWNRLSDKDQRTVMKRGHLKQPSLYSDEPYIITRNLIEEGRNHLLLRAPIGITCPVRLMHGLVDPDVPASTSLQLAERLPVGDVRVTLIKDGDHRLSRPQDLAVLGALVDELAAAYP